ncbi:MAG TPA: rRNA maturation RNase YbeY [Anaeromyxobacteraceae bacterium]|nr:rRNA maturation RNase YbeY [Anaeromyxobacteraceae bacterium]
MTVLVRSEHPRAGAAVRRLRVKAREYLRALGREEAELSILLTTDAGIRRLNRRWRAIDRPTDVLSFALSDPSGIGSLLGDVVISVDTAARRGGEDPRAVRMELDRYLAHGILHLLGFDHERPSDARVMAAREEALVRADGLVGAAMKKERVGRAGKGPRRREKS